jgi:hypothetical protein
MNGILKTAVLSTALLAAPLLEAAPKPGKKAPPRKNRVEAAPRTAAAPTAESAAPAGSELSSLQFLVGDWIHQELDHQGVVSTAVKRAARSKVSAIHNGKQLYVLYKTRDAAGAVVYEGRGVVSWDTSARAYRLDWFDSRGAALRYAGRENPDGALVFEGPSGPGEEAARESIRIEKQAGGKILISEQRAVGDSPFALFVESLAAVAPPPEPTASAETAVKVEGGEGGDPAARPTPRPTAVPGR